MLVRTQNVLVGGNGILGSISTNSPQWDTLTVGERVSHGEERASTAQNKTWRLHDAGAPHFYYPRIPYGYSEWPGKPRPTRKHRITWPPN